MVNLMHKKYTALFTMFFCLGFANAHAAKIDNAPEFIFPLACTYGEDCWPVNYVDVDPAQGSVQDFKCNHKTYDAHKGTDFALASVTKMNEGVDVLAAAAGRVLRVRDSQSDHLKSEDEMQSLKDEKKECGNGVLIDHGNGLKTIYCHLKKDSVVVTPKQEIGAGEKIAQVGQSGMAEFPHLHFGVLWEGGIVDPYTGMLNTDLCGKTKTSLWHPALGLEYVPIVIFDGGFRAKSPDFPEIQRGEEQPDYISVNSAAFVFWAGFYNVEEGDEINLRVTDPDGQIFVQRTEIQQTTRSRQYYYTGRKIGRVQLRPGLYKGHVTIKRITKNGKMITRTREFPIDVRG